MKKLKMILATVALTGALTGVSTTWADNIEVPQSNCTVERIIGVPGVAVASTLPKNLSVNVAISGGNQDKKAANEARTPVGNPPTNGQAVQSGTPPVGEGNPGTPTTTETSPPVENP